MHDERYVLTASGDHQQIRLRDQKTGEIYNFSGFRAFFDALGVLALLRIRDRGDSVR